MGIRKAATEAGKYFTVARRQNGGEYTHLRDSRPEWVRDMVFECHGDRSPKDFIFATIAAAVEGFANADDPDEVSIEPDIYTSDLLAWVAHFSEYADEVLAYGTAESFTDLLQQAQGRHIAEIVDQVRRCLEERAEEDLEDEDDEDDDADDE